MLGEDGRACEDVNECLTSRCDHTCENLIGGFRCRCREGYVLDADRVSCNGRQAKTMCSTGSLPFATLSLFIQTSMSVCPLMAAVPTTASTSREATNAPVETNLC